MASPPEIKTHVEPIKTEVPRIFSDKDLGSEFKLKKE